MTNTLLPNLPKGFFVYSRKSSEAEDRQVLSIDSQVREIHSLAEKLSIPIVEVLTEARSAKEPGRPVFNEMMKRIYRGEADGILCWKLDRLARNPVDGGAIIWAMKQHHIKLVTPAQTYSQDDENIIMVYIEFGMAQKYIDDLSRNVKRGLKMKAEQGWFPGKAPLGYSNKNKGRQGLNSIGIDPDRFSLVRKMWDLMLTESYSVREILRVANEDWGFRTRNNRIESNSPLSLAGIYRIFTNPFYYGEFEYPRRSGIWYKGVHQPVITREEYQRVQKILGRPGRPRRKSYTFAFTGLIRCYACNGMVTAENKRKKQMNGNTHHYVYYHCTKRRLPRCLQPSVEEKVLDRQIERYLSRIELPTANLNWALQYLSELHAQEKSDQLTVAANLQKTRDETQRALDELIRMRYLGLVDNEEYDRQRGRLKIELARLTEQLKQAETINSKCDAETAKTFRFACYALTCFKTGSAEIKKEILTAFGSNLLLKDKNLLLEAKKPFSIVETELNRLRAISSPFEPQDFLPPQRENVLSGVSRSVLCGLVDEVRTYFRNSNDDFYIPDLSCDEELREAA